MNHKSVKMIEINCLNTIRLLAAIQVAYGHIIVHMGISMPHWFGKALGYFQGVPIFLLLSGYFLWGGVERSTTYKDFLRRRFLKIYPELWVGVVVEAITLCLFYKVSDIKAFVLFLFGQSTIFQFWTPDSLRGYGCGTPNGSLATICVLIQFYIVVWFLKKLLRDKKIFVWFVAFAFSVMLAMLPNLLEGTMPTVVIKLYKQSLLNYMWLFIAGMFLAEYKRVILPVLIKYWYLFSAVGVCLYVVGIDIPFANYNVLRCVIGIYGMVGFAYAFPKFNIKTDITYGLYIYHMIVANVFISLGWIEKTIFLPVVLLISLGLAWISNRTVGEWSRRMKLEHTR